MRLPLGIRRAAALAALAGLIGLPVIVLPALPAQATDPVLHGTLLGIGHLPVAVDGVVRVFDTAHNLLVGEVAVGTDGTWALDVPVGEYQIQGAVLGLGDPVISQADFTTVSSGGEEGGPFGHELVAQVPTVSGHVLDHDLLGVDGASVALFDGMDFFVTTYSWGSDGYWAADAPSGDLHASAWVAGHVPSPATAVTAPTTSAEIVLGTPTLTGTLLAPTGSTPGGHRLIQARTVDGLYGRNGFTAADGSFELDVPDGSYQLWPFPDRPNPTEAGAASEVVVVDGGAVVSVGGAPAAGVDFRLATPEVMVEVLTPELDPSPAGAEVLVEGGLDVPSPMNFLRSDLLGNTFGLDLDDGDWVITVYPPANAEGWAPGQVTVTVSGGEVTAVDGAPASSVSIHYVVPNVSGRVLDQLGEPAPGVRVATADDRWSAITDIDGHFDIALPNGARQLTTMEPLEMNLGVVTVDVDVTGGELVSPTTLELHLPSANVVATVTDPITHLPVVGAYAELHPYGWWYNGSTDIDGNVPFVISDGDWELHVDYATVVTWRVVGGVITDVTNTGPLEVTLTPVTP